MRSVPASSAALPGAGYARAVELETTAERTPEAWARGVFEGAPALWRWVLSLGWRYVLGLRLAPSASPDHIAGWEIAAGDADAGTVTLAAHSRLLTARNIFTLGEGTVTWATVVRFEGRLGRLLWGAAAPVHRLTAPLLLRRAQR